MIEKIIQTETGYRATIDGQELVIPNAAGNRHWQMVQDAIAEGASVTVEQPPPAPIPDRVSRFQARAALMQAGLLDQAEAAVAQAGPLAQLAWNDAVEFRRNSPTINALAPALGLTAEQIDALFIAAAQIEA